MTREQRASEDVRIVAKYERNIASVYAKAFSDEIAEGLNWYASARNYARELSKRHSVPLTVACYVISALSPNCSWDRNREDSDTCIAAYKSRRKWYHVSCQTYGNNVRKAFDILKTGNLELVKANKTSAFAHNIAYENSDHVTIDSHAFSVAENHRYTSANMVRLTDRRYRNTATAYRNVASRLGIRPYQLQAICWVVWHRLITEDENQTAFAFGASA